ncbi:hypothetical protein [Actinomadura bangladeshensis]|uniref:Uncharacterized protein n=1 Tax=Actinomadura bangladeshensis TaxID=453573 RepID=A0A4R4NE00_9ACTN|nr:hypothetical protein [Actinomadura bangladeshensis]TDC07179.1 hypothetical protein E1284_32805 [Actinomadura bangladeshensis]
MCVHDLAGKEAAIRRFLREHPTASAIGRDHPLLRGLDDASWSQIPGCPAAIPVLIRGLLDAPAQDEALRILGIVLTDDVFHLNPAMALALPYLIKLSADKAVPGRAKIIDFLVVIAEYVQPVGDTDPRLALLFGSDERRPERAECKAVFIEHAAILRPRLADLPFESQGALLAAITAA